MSEIDPRLRALLQCPSCGEGLDDQPGALHCPACKASWPVDKGVPLLVPEAKVSKPARRKRPRKGRR